MSPIDNVTHYRAKVGALSRAVKNGERPRNDPALAKARQDLAAAKVADYINRTLADAPPLTNEQRTRLAELLKPLRRPMRNGDAAFAAQQESRTA